jgi:predicted nucleotidyltransferase
VRRSVKRFLLAVQQDRRIDAAYVYGSQTRGTSTEWSDIDVAVISPDFTSDRFEERVMLMRLAAQIDDRIEPHPFTPWDFQSSDPLADEVRNTGIRVA